MTKENIMIAGIVLALVIGLFGLVGGNNQSDQILERLDRVESMNLGGGTRFPNGISADTTSPSGAGNIRGTTLNMTGTTTIASSFDGFIAYDNVDTVATGSAVATFTNNFSPGVCDGGVGAVYFDSTAFSPSLQVSLGILTDVDLMATTTIATTTDTLTELIDNSFLLASGGTVKLYLDDITNTEASSTNYGNWDIQFGVTCWTLGG